MILTELSEEAKEARRKYYREYYKNNKEKRKRYQNNLWERRATDNLQSCEINNKYIEIIHKRNQNTERVNSSRRSKDNNAFTVRIRKNIVSHFETIQAYQLSVGSDVTPLSKLVNDVLEEYCIKNKILVETLIKHMEANQNDY